MNENISENHFQVAAVISQTISTCQDTYLRLSTNKVPKHEDWRPKKNNKPDSGTYEQMESYKKISKRPSTAMMLKTKIKSFNEQAAFDKRHVPSPGVYNYIP